MTDPALADRIARLERRNRWLTGSLVVMAVSSFAGLGLANADSTRAAPGDLTARSLTIVDGAGVARVKIAAPVPAPIIMGKTKPRDGPVSGILLYDAKGNERSGYVTSDSKDYPNVLFTLDDERHQRVLFLAEPGGATTLRLFKDKQNMAEINLVDDQPGIRLVKDGKAIFQAPSQNAR